MFLIRHGLVENHPGNSAPISSFILKEMELNRGVARMCHIHDGRPHLTLFMPDGSPGIQRPTATKKPKLHSEVLFFTWMQTNLLKQHWPVFSELLWL